jgi:hypothetical protein
VKKVDSLHLWYTQLLSTFCLLQLVHFQIFANTVKSHWDESCKEWRLLLIIYFDGNFPYAKLRPYDDYKNMSTLNTYCGILSTNHTGLHTEFDVQYFILNSLIASFLRSLWRTFVLWKVGEHKLCMGQISGTWEILLCDYWRKSMIIGEKNTDFEKTDRATKTSLFDRNWTWQFYYMLHVQANQWIIEFLFWLRNVWSHLDKEFNQR